MLVHLATAPWTSTSLSEPTWCWGFPVLWMDRFLLGLSLLWNWKEEIMVWVDGWMNKSGSQWTHEQVWKLMHALVNESMNGWTNRYMNKQVKKNLMKWVRRSMNIVCEGPMRLGNWDRWVCTCGLSGEGFLVASVRSEDILLCPGENIWNTAGMLGKNASEPFWINMFHSHLHRYCVSWSWLVRLLPPQGLRYPSASAATQ